MAIQSHSKDDVSETKAAVAAARASGPGVGAVAFDATGLLAAVCTPPRCGGGGAPAVLSVPLGGRVPPAVVDPVSGAVMRLRCGTAVEVSAPRRVREPLARSRRFWLETPLDVAIHRLRSVAPPVSRYTNEAVSTAGTPTGIDSTLLRQPLHAQKGSRL